MGDLPREAHEPDGAETVGMRADDPGRMPDAIEALSTPQHRVFTGIAA